LADRENTQTLPEGERPRKKGNRVVSGGAWGDIWKKLQVSMGIHS